jgi:hypothetical protein
VAGVIFVLGALASTLCAVLLLRSYLAERVPRDDRSQGLDYPQAATTVESSWVMW